MNFKVIKGDNFWDKKEIFIELYNKNTPMKDIREKLELSITQYNKLVKECSNEGSITSRRKTHLNGGIIK